MKSSSLALINLRKRLGLTQRQLAKKAGIPQSTIARIEAGSNSSIDMLTHIGKAVDMELKLSYVKAKPKQTGKGNPY
ncbi:XRE family transcriptional regulator [Ligilactobacillus agilis]|uniref:XRE family transcriptional regulator n=1 Tax=Ligilactobacillus agilis TaxID=1601 RepID=A0A2I2ACH6_9LACO|nr:helix-turn-helix transcriptional regulator [Ligilactobacillus agilis]PLA77076.1 XRE family transcriptional regulator [Ligilactobacillus agilis]PLA83317.1 XRE family transcriptional regulator [Ligilactobacillus agilis]